MSGIPARPGGPVPAAIGDDREGALLALPRNAARTQEQARLDAAGEARQRREAGIQVCCQLIAEGCGGGRTEADPEGCTDPAHGEHVAAALDLLYETGAVPGDPLSKDRRHFGKAPREVAG